MADTLAATSHPAIHDPAIEPDSTDFATVDSVTFLPPFADPMLCAETEAPSDPRLVAKARPSYSSGLEPAPRPELPAYDSGVVCLILGVIVFLALNTRHQSNYLKTFAVDLFTVRRRRTNAFDDSTVNETRTIIAFIALLCVAEGILLFTATNPHGVASDIFGHIAMTVGLCVAYYVFEICAYATIATVFGTPLDRSQWLKGFNASQALLGLTLAVPALLALFSPDLSWWWLRIALVLYVVARMIFIIKGYRIFYTDFASNIYFILYLLALEVVPPVAIFNFALRHQ